MSNLLPLVDLSKVEFADKKSGNILLKYMKGLPRQYRFDASNGIFKVKGDKSPLTNEGEPITLIPIAYEIFTDNILGVQYDRMRWLEVIFLNQKLQVCSMLLHGYSVDNFMQIIDDLYYDDERNFCQVKLTINPIKKISKSPEAKGAKYFVAGFRYELVDAKELEKLETATKGLDLFRKDIYTIDREIELSKNYGVPAEIKKQLAADKVQTGEGSKPAASKKPAKDKAAAA